MDLGLSAFVALAALLLAVAYGVRVAGMGRARHARVDAEGQSALVPKSAMEMFYWSLTPIAAACARVGIGANTITWMSLVLGALASGAIAMGHFGIGTTLALLSAAGDALDGLVARHTKTDSQAGEVLDATVDRYVELLLLAGVAIHVRESALALVLTLGAIGGSFMVSYSTAKAEALGITPPRGSMRRTERAVLLIVGIGLVPLLGSFGMAQRWAEAPLLAALAAIAIFGNASAVARLVTVAKALRAPR